MIMCWKTLIVGELIVEEKLVGYIKKRNITVYEIIIIRKITIKATGIKANGMPALSATKKKRTESPNENGKENFN